MTDNEKLVSKYLLDIRQGDSSALSPLYDLTNKQLYSLCYTYLKDSYASEDAVSDTYMTAMRHIQKFKGSNGFNWLYTIAKNTCLNMKKKQGRTINVDYSDEKTVNKLNFGAIQEYEIQEDNEVFRIAKHVLKDIEFRIVVLHVAQGFKFKEIAVIIGRLESTVRWQYNNALKKLRNKFEETGL